MPSKRSQLQKTPNTICFPLYDVPRIVNSETQSRMVVAMGWGQGGMGSQCLMGTEFQFQKMKEVLEMDGGDSFTTI